MCGAEQGRGDYHVLPYGWINLIWYVIMLSLQLIPWDYGFEPSLWPPWDSTRPNIFSPCTAREALGATQMHNHLG